MSFCCVHNLQRALEKEMNGGVRLVRGEGLDEPARVAAS